MALNPPPDGQFIFTPHPLLLDGQRVETWRAAPGQTLAALLAVHAPAALDDTQIWMVCIGGVPVRRDCWAHLTPKPGQMIEVRGGTGKAALGIVAFVALSYFTFGMGSFGGMAGLIGGAGGMAAATGVFMAGSMLINKVLAPRPPRPADQPNTVYSIGTARNQIRQHQPLPLVFGRVRHAPDIIGAAYPWYQGNDQYLGMVLTPGINAGRVEALSLGETLLSTYDGARVWHSGFPGMPEHPIPLYGNADSIAGAELDRDGTWIERTTPQDTVRATVNLEYILGDNDRKGAKNNHETVEIRYRKTGTQAWQVLATQRFVNNTYDTLRTSFSKDLPKGQYDIRVRRLGRAIEHSQGRAQFAWTSLTAVQSDDADYAGIPRIGVELKASGQLQQADELRCVVHARPLPVWKGQGAGWVTEETSNPGAHLLAYARGIRDHNNRPLAGMFLHEHQIDIPSLQAFMLHCAAEGYTYDYVVKDARNHDVMCNALALAGLGQIAWSAGRLGVIWAADGQPVQGVVNMATIQRSSFQIDYTLANAADGIEYSYYDASDWSVKTLRVAVPGQTVALNPASVTGEGITREAHAARLARYHLAQSLYQYKDIQFTADLEHLSYRRMSLLALQHDLTQWGHGGRVQAAEVVNGKVVLTLDEPVPAPTTGNAFIGLRIPGERVCRVFKIVPFTGQRDMLTLSDPWPSDAPLPGSGAQNPAADTLWIYDARQTPGYRVRVVGIEPATDFSSARVRVVPESPEFWDYVLNGHYTPPANASLLATRPAASKLTITESQVTQGNTVYTELSASFDISGAMAHATIHSAFKDGQDWSGLQQVAETRSTSARWRIPAAGVYRIIVRPHTAEGITGSIAETTYATTGAQIPPPAFDWFNVEALPGGVRKYTWGYHAQTREAPDLAGAEIGYIAGTHSAPDWASLTPLGSAGGFLTNGAEFSAPPAGDWTFAVRARNTSGEVSAATVLHRSLSDNLGERLGGVDDHIAGLIAQQQAIDQSILEQLDLIELNAQTLLQDIARSTHFHDITRQHGDRISRAVHELTLLDEGLKVTAQSLTELYATVAGLDSTQQAHYQELITAIADEVSARVTALSELHAQMLAGDNAVTAALAQQISEVEATAEAARANLQTTLAAAIMDGDTAVSQALNQTISDVAATAEAARTSLKTYLEAQMSAGDTALSSAIHQRIDSVEASEAAARATLETTLGAQIADSVAQAKSELTVDVNAVSAQVEQVDTHVAALGTSLAATQTQLAANVTATSANASSINSLLATADGHSAAITSLNQVSTEHGARHTLALSVDGLVSGYTSDNDGTVASFNIAAHVFRLLAPGNAADGMEIRDGHLRVWRGNSQRIIGNGFGPNADLMEYFGPNVGAANASKANATMWMDIHGNAYWGGEVLSGPLTYTTRTDSTHTVGLELINGPFPTNGALRTVTVHFSRGTRFQKYAGNIELGAGSNTATVQIYRKIGDAGEALWHTLHVGGSASIINVNDGHSMAWLSWNGQHTITDTSPSTQTVRYRALITAFTQQAVTAYGEFDGTFDDITSSQSLKITSIEGTP